MGEVTRKEERITFEMMEDGGINLQVPSKGALCDLFGTDSYELAANLLVHAVGTAGSGDGSSAANNREFMVGIIRDFAPRDATERMLAVQMGATHAAMMKASHLMADAGTVQGFEAYDRCLNRLARTYAAQMEALRKHRNGGQSKVIVEHFTVNEGGQAIVGTVERGRGDDGK